MSHNVVIISENTHIAPASEWHLSARVRGRRGQYPQVQLVRRGRAYARVVSGDPVGVSVDRTLVLE